jgi:putative transposase
MNYENADGFKIRDQSAYHFLTFTVVGWIDIFSRQCYRNLIINSFKYCQEHKGLKIGAWVIMSNHIHVIWKAQHNNLSDVIRDFKTFTSKAISKQINQPTESRKDWLLYLLSYYAKKTNANEHFKVWTNNNHPEAIYSEAFLLSKLNYIHQNPIRASIVTEADHYLYSSAVDYSGSKGLVDIEFLL